MILETPYKLMLNLCTMETVTIGYTIATSAYYHYRWKQWVVQPAQSTRSSGSTVTMPSSLSEGKWRLASALRLGYSIPFLSGHDRSANLILNLFSLMLNAGVPDIALEPDKTVQKVLVHIHTI